VALRAVLGPSPKSVRVEYRLAGADINPYLAIAASLASGLHGIEKTLELPPASTGSAYETDARPLPRSLADATALLKASPIARDLLGEEFVDHYVRTREWEVRQYERAVTDWELERYFEII
ncbi:MAG: glutamine synthetase, partial [Acidobacteria bacterium]